MRDAGNATALARVMAALATLLPVAARGGVRQLDRPLLWRSAFYRREAASKTRAASPDRPFACWSLPAQLAAICLLEDVVGDDHAWRELADRDLVGDDDRSVARGLLGRPARPTEPSARAGKRPEFRVYCRKTEKVSARLLIPNGSSERLPALFSIQGAMRHSIRAVMLCVRCGTRGLLLTAAANTLWSVSPIRAAGN